MKLLLLGSQHGNERLGDALYAHLLNHHSNLVEYIKFMVGNPKAHKKNVRFIESDLNRSYNSSLNTYESRRAQRIQKHIHENNFDIVLDLHTTTCKQPPSVIVADLNERRRKYLRSSAINKIVVIRHPIVKTSLLYENRNVIAVEVGESDIDYQLLESLAQDIRRFIANETLPGSRFVYTVDHLLLKDEVRSSEIQQLINFKRSPGGYIPILTGENSYKKNTHYLGFKALKEVVITV